MLEKSLKWASVVSGQKLVTELLEFKFLWAWGFHWASLFCCPWFLKRKFSSSFASFAKPANHHHSTVKRPRKINLKTPYKVNCVVRPDCLFICLFAQSEFIIQFRYRYLVEGLYFMNYFFSFQIKFVLYYCYSAMIFKTVTRQSFFLF